MSTTRHSSICSLCGQMVTDNDLFIEGLGGGVCFDCAQMISQIVGDIKATEHSHPQQFDHIPTPHEIKDFLDQYVIGQDSAKRKIAVAVYNHYKRISYQSKDGVEIEKSNIVLLGPSGTGKTLIAQTIARMLDVPFAIADATSLTQSGYVGEDVESILTKLLRAADGDVERAERGIVFIDEIDKIALKSGSTSITRDVSGEGVQQGLLKMLEGSVVSVPPNGGRIHPEQKLIPVNTKNILFICGGAFVGIEEEIAHRFNKQTVGFNAAGDKKEVNSKHILDYVTPADLRSFGLIPELIGRLPIIAHTDKLDKDAMLDILTKPKNSLVKQYKKLFEIDGIKLTFENGVMEVIADKALENEIGARGLRGIMERVMENAMFDAPSKQRKTYRVTKKYASDVLGDVA